MIKREGYLSKIREFYDIDLIKVITGIRRCGKSFLLKQVMEELSHRVDSEHIIYLNFEDVTNDDIKDDKDLDNYIKSKIKDNEKYYLFFDEIGRVEKWGKAISSFKATMNVSVFITSSSSSLVSGELATLLTGRYVSFKIYPFTFKEVCEYKNILGKDKYELKKDFDEYLLWGGIPLRFELKRENSVMAYLSDMIDGIINNDIRNRNISLNITLFKELLQYFGTNPCQKLTLSKIIEEYESDDLSISTKTIYEYLDIAKDCYLLEEIPMYDIQKKRVLPGNDKYYLTDLGLGQVNNTSPKLQYEAYLENVVYNELLYRGYDVLYGVNNEQEIDFIATKGNIKEYYQVALKLADEKTEKREFGAYEGIGDNYPKYVISMDTLDYSQEGIIHKNIIDWLLRKREDY